METNCKGERIRELRQDPDFRALVTVLESQSPEQLALFYSHYESSEDGERGENVREIR